jgi:hypothetical protein
LQYTDMPAVRGILRDADNNSNRFSSLVVGIVRSEPFQMREVLKTGDSSQESGDRSRKAE